MKLSIAFLLISTLFATSYAAAAQDRTPQHSSRQGSVNVGQVPSPRAGVDLKATAGFMQIGSVPFGTNSFTDTTPVSGQMTNYEVIAVNASGSSAPSAIVSASTPTTNVAHGTAITWTPSAPCAAPVNCTPASYGVFSLVVSVPPSPLAIGTTSLPAGAVGTPYSTTLSATGGTAPYTWTVSGLPAGLAVSGSTITGTPTAAGAVPVTLTVTDSESPIVSIISTVTLTVSATQVSTVPYVFQPSVTSLTFAGTTGGSNPAAQTLRVSDSTPCPPPSGVPVCNWPFTTTHSQPWLTVSPAGGTTSAALQVSANTAGLTAGTYTDSVVLTVTPQNGFILSKTPLSIPVTLTLTGGQTTVVVAISPTAANIVTGATQQFSATVTGSSNTSVTWSATAGTITTTGLFTAPLAAGAVTVTAKSVASPTKSVSATVTVTAPPPPPLTITCTGVTCSIGGGSHGQQVTVQVNPPNGPKTTATIP